MTLSSTMKISSSGMAAERFRMDVIASNIANSNSIATGGRPAYQRRTVVLQGGQDGVKVTGLEADRKPFRVVHDPTNPAADAEGNVTYSNVEPVFEMVDMISASRAYEANIAAFNTARGMIRSALQIGKV